MRALKLFLYSLVAGLAAACTLSAQNYSNIHIFTNYPTDGAQPQAPVIVSGNTLYGTASYGGNETALSGSLFKVNSDGSGFTNFYFFTAASYPGYPHTNSDGAAVVSPLVILGNTVYGTASGGGSTGNGTIFAVHTDGTGFTNLHNFTPATFGGVNPDGYVPYGGLCLSGNRLYGTASGGGTYGSGLIFALNTDGSGFTNLYSFTGVNDGAAPFAGVILAGDTLYGTAEQGGYAGSGTVFAVGTNGLGFTNLYSFSLMDPDTGTNADGAQPEAPLVLSGTMLYGTAAGGGNPGGGGSGNGTVFGVSTNGLIFTNLYVFSGDGNYDPNNDGAVPVGGLIVSGNRLYGTTSYGGTSDNGAVFSINTDGSDFTNLFSFGPINFEGIQPLAGVTAVGTNLFGTTIHGGDGVDGTVYELSGELPAPAAVPQLSIAYSGGRAVVSWPPALTGWTLQTNNNLVSGVWGNYAGVTVGNITTNAASASMVYFRLYQP